VLRANSAYVRNLGLGGAMFWSLDGDTPDGELITAVDRGLNVR
jgi:chitinase